MRFNKGRFLRKIREKWKKEVHKKEVCFAVALILSGNALGTFFAFTGREGRAAEKLERPEYGEGDRRETLKVYTGGKEEEIELLVREKQYSKEEEKKLLEQAEVLLEKIFQERGIDWKKIEENLVLPTALEGSPVGLSWSTDNPEVLNWEGTIGNGAKETGTEVQLFCHMSIGEQEKFWKKEAVVFPLRISGKTELQQAVQAETDRKNKEDSEVVYLPAVVQGKEVRYEKQGEQKGRVICLLSVAIGIGILPIRKERERQRQAEKRLEMQRDYPEIADRLVLFLKAGLSIRKAMEKLAADYIKMRRIYGIKERSSYEEIVKTCQEMESGIYEAEAYERMGKRCALPEYKVLSVLLVQNLKKGNQNLLELLEREAAAALEERKRRAKIRGEEASTKLLLPMILQLMVVFIILIVPAFLSFF